MAIDETYLKAFIHGTLSPEEMQAAKARVAADPDFAQAVGETRLLLEVAELSLRARMREQARAAEARAGFRAGKGAGLGEGTVSSRSRKGVQRYWAVAATVVLLVGLGAFWVLWPPVGERIFDRYFDAPDSREKLLGAPDTMVAYSKYAAEDYAGALPLFQAIPASNTGWTKAQFFIAICQLELDSTDAAIAGLRAYIEREHAYSEAQWYLGLALLRAGQDAEAVKVLKGLRDSRIGIHDAEIAEILERVE